MTQLLGDTAFSIGKPYQPAVRSALYLINRCPKRGGNDNVALQLNKGRRLGGRLSRVIPLSLLLEKLAISSWSPRKQVSYSISNAQASDRVTILNILIVGTVMQISSHKDSASDFPSFVEHLLETSLE